MVHRVSSDGEDDGKGEYFEQLDAYWRRQTWPGFYGYLRNSEIAYARPGRAKVEIPVTSDMLNGMGTLHGGATASILDVLMPTSIWTPDRTEFKQVGVTVDMSVVYAAAARASDTLIVDVQLLKRGKTIAFFRGDIYKKGSGELVASAQQTLSILAPDNKSKM